MIDNLKLYQVLWPFFELFLKVLNDQGIANWSRGFIRWICNWTEYSPIGGTEYQPTGGTEYPPIGGTEYLPIGGKEYPPIGGTEYPLIGGTEYPPIGETEYQPIGGTEYPPIGGLSEYRNLRSVKLLLDFNQRIHL